MEKAWNKGDKGSCGKDFTEEMSSRELPPPQLREEKWQELEGKEGYYPQEITEMGAALRSEAPGQVGRGGG